MTEDVQETTVNPNEPCTRRTKSLMRKVSVGLFHKRAEVHGQITTCDKGNIAIEHARCADLLLMTKGNGPFC